jgi:hypothetical protein
MIYSSLQHALSLPSLPCLHQLPGNYFQCHRYLSHHDYTLLAGDCLTAHSAMLHNSLQWGLLTSHASTRGDSLTTTSDCLKVAKDLQTYSSKILNCSLFCPKQGCGAGCGLMLPLWTMTLNGLKSNRATMIHMWRFVIYVTLTCWRHWCFCLIISHTGYIMVHL